MKMGSDEWHAARITLEEPLDPFLLHSVMGASNFVKENLRITIKHRMRKDKVGVVTICCWRITPGEYEYKVVLYKTTALTQETANLGPDLLKFLEDGVIPESVKQLNTYPGYEDLDRAYNL